LIAAHLEILLGPSRTSLTPPNFILMLLLAMLLLPFLILFSNHHFPPLVCHLLVLLSPLLSLVQLGFDCGELYMKFFMSTRL
jgi:hypothetical protein